MQIIQKKINDIHPYEKNPRIISDDAVEKVANSIKEFGFKVPLVIDKEGTIVTGHTRMKAAEKIGMKEVPCIVADDLTQEQIKAFRLADNKVSEFSGWDFDELYSEVTGIMDINMSDFGFDFSEPDLSGIEFNETPAEQKEPDKKTIVCPKCGEVIEI